MKRTIITLLLLMGLSFGWSQDSTVTKLSIGGKIYTINNGIIVNDPVSFSNVGTAGLGIYVRKTGSIVELKKLNIGSSKITLTDDVANDEIDIDINESALSIGPANIQTDAVSGSKILDGSISGVELADNLLDTAKYQDGSITLPKLDSQNTITDGYIPVANLPGSNFNWIDPATLVGPSTFVGLDTQIADAPLVKLNTVAPPAVLEYARFSDSNTLEGLTAAEVRADLNIENGAAADQTSAEVSYDNTNSGLAASNVKEAIDEVEANKVKEHPDTGQTGVRVGVGTQAEKSVATLLAGDIWVCTNCGASEEITAGSTDIDFAQKGDYVYLDNTTDDVVNFTISNANSGYVAEIYLNQATEPAFTPAVTIKADTLDWTADALANTDITLTIKLNGKGTYEGVYTKGN